MDVQVVSLLTFEAIRKFVRETLCERDRLDPDQARLRQALIQKRNKPCGLFFQVQGPRLLRTYAVWAGEEDRILFYDSTGARFGETRLSESPDPEKLTEKLTTDEHG